MKFRTIALGAALAAAGASALLAATSAHAQAKEQFFPVLSGRTGPVAPNATPWANGHNDYMKLVNARGGINGVMTAGGAIILAGTLCCWMAARRKIIAVPLALLGIGAELIGQVFVGIVGQAPGNPPAPADPESDGRGLIRVIPAAEGFVRRPGCWNLEEPFHALLAVSRDREFLQSRLAPVDEDEQVPVAAIRARRRDELGQRIVVEFLVDYDPHPDGVLPHHGKDHPVPLNQPAFANPNLFGPRKQGRIRAGLQGLRAERG